ncbi:hypothetical protein ZIOFF_019265 [Zingiber officinale]|uniref:Retrovirus-related Pol polyprotein from transposon TNT 1-94-like beta-barrel domain-containing protein n=1 Tax=Zingiber officinale TaxID=94328 RepID=A0A8J5HHJ7_ZINOF|nr:hypothetical protein ZIOFF_019265 [Zingiber officinale]
MLVRLGDNKRIQVEGKDTIAVVISDGKVKLLYNVYFVPSLAHSLLSVGQLMMGDYAIVFDNRACVISDKDSGKSIVSVQMTENKIFPLKISNVGNQAFIASEDNKSKMRHLRYGHLNIKGMQLLNQKEDRTLTTEGVESSPLESPAPSPSNSRSSSSSSLQESSDKAPPAKVRSLREIYESRFMQNPMKHHLGAAKKILRYVAGTVDYGIYYSKVSKFDLYGFTDSDWSNSVDDRRSTSATDRVSKERPVPYGRVPIFASASGAQSLAHSSTFHSKKTVNRNPVHTRRRMNMLTAAGLGLPLDPMIVFKLSSLAPAALPEWIPCILCISVVLIALSNYVLRLRRSSDGTGGAPMKLQWLPEGFQYVCSPAPSS